MSRDNMNLSQPDCLTIDVGENMAGVKRVFLIVLDSFGIGGQPDAKDFGDEGSNTLAAVAKSSAFQVPNMSRLGLFSIDGVREDIEAARQSLDKNIQGSLYPLPAADYVPIGSYARLLAKAKGKDTTIGHWEMAGVISDCALPVYPQGFPADVITEFEHQTGRKVICNLPYSGTDVIRDYGLEQVQTGALIVYTSADSVFQVAAHEDVVPVEELYHYCELAREILVGPYAVGRVIARPFAGEYPDYKRTSRRHDISLLPPRLTILDVLLKNHKDVIGIGKIHDIFAGRGLSRFMRTSGNEDGLDKTKTIMGEPFDGLCFVNLVDFDMLYGHRNDVDGYAAALTAFDKSLGELLTLLAPDDMLMITADHGCDPSTPSTDHSRESVPLLVYGSKIKGGIDLGVRNTFADIGATIAAYLEVPATDRAVLDGQVIDSILHNNN